MLYYTLWFGESQHLFLIFFIFIFFIFCIFIWCNFVQCFFYFWQRISDLGCLIVDAAVYTVEISSEWTGFSFFQVFFLPFPIFGRFLVRSWACAWTNQTFTYHFTFLFSLFIIWKQADLFTDQPDKTSFYISAEYLCARSALISDTFWKPPNLTSSIFVWSPSYRSDFP